MALKRLMGVVAAAGALALGLGGAAQAQPTTLPPGFTETTVLEGWDGYLGVVFAPNGLGFAWTKDGRVFRLDINGNRSANPVIDIRPEVGNWRDLGLLGVALHPDFLTNGLIYLLYNVDYHHLTKFGTPQYNPATDEYNRDTIARLTRYRLRPETGFLQVDPTSRFILVGESITTGFPVTHQSHSIGTVTFGRDGSLLVGSGDGASYDEVDDGGPRTGSSNTALAEGIIKPKEDVGAFRSQMLDSLSGKVLRLDPMTGDGMADNPFYDAANPRSARSRVWLLGLRNPFRFTVRPDNEPEAHEGPPVGTIYMGEVGWNLWEELAVARTGGKNFGWPLFEGLEPQPAYQAVAGSVFNQDAPNPLFGVGGCTQPYLPFSALIVQDTLAAGSWPNPCNAGQQLVGTPAAPLFKHFRPALDWTWNGARAPTYTGPNATLCQVGSPGCVTGGNFVGRSSTGGTFYTGTSYPPEYRNTYFHADWSGNWIYNFVFDDADRLLEIRPFAPNIPYVVHMTVHPITGDIWYTRFVGYSFIKKISYGGGASPQVQVTPAVSYGPLPLTVNFSTAGTFDPDGDPLTYTWDFGDGTPISNSANPTHTFWGPGDIASEGTIVARVLNLTPPGTQGAGGTNIELIRDNDRPLEGILDGSRQYELYRFLPAEKTNFEWIGYTFPQQRRVHTLIYQEGVQRADGGWIVNPTVEYFNGSTWQPVTNMQFDPPYPGANGVNYETFTITFDAVDCVGIRLAGEPGGSEQYFGVAELRPIAVATSAYTTPQKFDVTLTVSDPSGRTVTRKLVVSGNNTPPEVEMTSPVNNDRYAPGVTTQLPLTAAVSDAESSNPALAYEWRVFLHHQDHFHAEPAITTTTATVPVDGFGCADNEIYHYEVQLKVTDPHGLSTSVRSFIFPDCGANDYNRDGFLNLDDLGDYLTDFYQPVAIPGGAQPAAPTYPNQAAGWAWYCPQAADAPPPYAVDSYRRYGYRVAFAPAGTDPCPVDPAQIFPNLDHLNDFITAYYEAYMAQDGD
jgi:glucose/arabinose dehydrogenase